jgi:hypothetical protein
MGGSPGLLKGYPTITMTSEVIKMTVTDPYGDCSDRDINTGRYRPIPSSEQLS